MEPNEMEENYLEKTMASGEVMSLSKINGLQTGYDVDQWDKSGDNRWHRWYATYEKAKAEYDRWN